MISLTDAFNEMQSGCVDTGVKPSGFNTVNKHGVKTRKRTHVADVSAKTPKKKQPRFKLQIRGLPDTYFDTIVEAFHAMADKRGRIYDTVDKWQVYPCPDRVGGFGGGATHQRHKSRY